MLPDRGNKQQQQQFSQKESRWTRSKRSVRESEMPKVAPKGTKHRPSSAPLLPAVPHRPAAALRRTRRRRSTLRAAVWRSKLRRRLTEPPAVVRHRAAAPRLREPSPVYAALPRRAHRVDAT